MSHTGPNEGTLMVNPLLHLSIAYFLPKPLFKPLTAPQYWSPEITIRNFEPRELDNEMSSELHGAALGHGQELNQIMHPHLDLRSTMAHIPQIKPCDFVVWHCER
jgi:hypothetical protein